MKKTLNIRTTKFPYFFWGFNKAYQCELDFKTRIYKNLETGSVVEGLLMDVVPSGYRELKAGEVDAAQEKHVPQVSVEDHKITVVVGSV